MVVRALGHGQPLAEAGGRGVRGCPRARPAARRRPLAQGEARGGAARSWPSCGAGSPWPPPRPATRPAPPGADRGRRRRGRPRAGHRRARRTASGWWPPGRSCQLLSARTALAGPARRLTHPRAAPPAVNPRRHDPGGRHGRRGRARRLAMRIRQIVAATLEHEVKDPRLAMVTITDARVTPDLRDATVFYTVYGDEHGARRTRPRPWPAPPACCARAVGSRPASSSRRRWPSSPTSSPRPPRRLEEAARARPARPTPRSRRVAAGATYAGEPDPYRKPARGRATTRTTSTTSRWRRGASRPTG